MHAFDRQTDRELVGCVRFNVPLDTFVQTERQPDRQMDGQGAFS